MNNCNMKHRELRGRTEIKKGGGRVERREGESFQREKSGWLLGGVGTGIGF